MSGKTHRLKIGDVVCIVLHEGFSMSEASADAIRGGFPNATPDEIEDALALRSYGDEQPSMHMNVLTIESAGTRILVDTGMGSGAGPVFGHVTPALQAEGIRPADIDIVFISHFHPDHFGGLLTEDGQPQYPNSRFITTQIEWDHWTHEDTLKAIDAPFAASLRALVDRLDQFSFLAAGDTLAPGITLVDAPGHSPGHTGLLIESNGERLLAVVDLLHSLPQFKYPHWHFAYDSDRSLAAQSRQRLLARGG